MMLVVALWKSGFCFFELCCKTKQNSVNTRILLYTKYSTLYNIMLLQSQVCFTTLVGFNLQKLPGFSLHPWLSPVKAELSSFSLKAVKESEKV